MPAADRLAISIEHNDGTIDRWGPDEPDGRDIPSGLRTTTSIPGGFKDSSVTLPRAAGDDNTDLYPYESIRIYGPGNETVWEGRQAQFPATGGDEHTINVGAVGHAAHLRDDRSFREIYVDRDMTRWKPMTSTRRRSLLSGASPFTISDPTIASDPVSLVPTLDQTLLGSWSIRAINEALYDAGSGLTIGDIYYDWVKSATVDNADVNYQWIVQTAANADTFASPSSTANLRAASSVPGYLNPGGDYRYGALQFLHGAAKTSAGTNYVLSWKNLVVYGSHTLTRRGTDPGGFYASDIVADIVDRAAPLLTYTTGTDGSIEPSTIVVPHCVFPTPTNAETAILDVNKYVLNEWGVYDNREFFWRSPDPDRLCWEVRIDQGASVNEAGITADEIYNGVVVYYKLGDGTERIAGPPGSGFDITDASLADTSALNPINAAGIPKRWAELSIGPVTTDTGAVQIGQVYLAERGLPTFRGDLTARGTAWHPTKGERPVWAIRAGDYIRVPDYFNTDPRRILETTYTHDTREIQCTLDNSSFKLEAILELMGVSLIGVIT